MSLYRIFETATTKNGMENTERHIFKLKIVFLMDFKKGSISVFYDYVGLGLSITSLARNLAFTVTKKTKKRHFFKTIASSKLHTVEHMI